MDIRVMGAGSVLGDAAVLGLVLVAILRCFRIFRRRYRHHRSANKRFMAGYRAGYRAAQKKGMEYASGTRTGGSVAAHRAVSSG